MDILTIILAAIIFGGGLYLGRYLLEMAALRGAYVRPAAVGSALIVAAVLLVLMIANGLSSVLFIAFWLFVGIVVGAFLRGGQRRR